MAAETEVSILPIVPIESRDRRSSSQHPIIPDGPYLKNLWGHLGERLGHVGKAPDLLQTICGLLLLQYRKQLNPMQDALYCQPMNTVLVQFDDDSVVKGMPAKFRGDMMVMEPSPLSWTKRQSRRKKYRTFDF